MKPLMIAFVLFVWTCNAVAQPDLKVRTDEIGQVNAMENLMRALSYTRNIEIKEENIEGSAYLDEQFTDGVVALTTGATYTEVPLRYNVYNDEIEFRNRKGVVFNINNPASIRELTIGKSKFIYTDCKHRNENKKLFAEVIAEGNANLLKHHRIKLVNSKPAQTHRAAEPPKLVKIPSEYMIRTADGPAQLFKNEKELLKLLADKGKEIKELIKQQNLSIHQEEDLLAIIRFYNGV